ncbi:MAG TPA: hypothetical protein VLY23_12565 [Candidatus Acidoferrum sp.]|nr:hypothetical protein [Candidatus Acidoferrum sp.]
MGRMRQIETLRVVLLVSLTVALAACGGGSERTLPPPLSNPAAVLVSLSPTSVLASGDAFTLTVNGSNFGSSAVVGWNGQAVPTTVVSSQQVTAAISQSLIASAGVVTISVQNADSNASNGLQFSVNNPTPQITSISPDTVMAGSPPVLLTINGSGFEATTYLLINGSAQPPQSQTPTQLQLTIPSNQLATATSITISAANLAPTAGPSNQVAFTVTPFTSNPAPALTSALDPSVPAGWPGFQLHVFGTNFVAASVLQWNGVNRPTTVISSTELAGAIPAGQLTSPGTVQVSVGNPSPGGGASGPLSIEIQSFSPNATGVIERSDIGTDLTEPDGGSGFPAVSSNGRFVALVSSADNLFPNTQTEFEDNLFLRDTCIGAPAGCVPSLTFISPAWDRTPAISADGRFVAFVSDAGISMYDSCAGAPAGCVPGTRIIDDSSNGQDGQASLSADGRFAVFFSGDLDCGYWDVCDGARVFLDDTCAGTSSGCTPGSQAISSFVEAYNESGTSLLGTAHPSISPDGRFVVFNTNTTDVTLYDSCQGAGASCSPSSTVVSVAHDGGPSDGISFGAFVSAGGRYVAFLSSASNLVPGNVTPGIFRVYLRDMCTGAPSGCTPATTLIAVAGDSSYAVTDPSISADGRYVAFASAADDLVPGDTNGVQDIFVRDTCAGVSTGCTPSTARVSIALDGTQGNGDSFGPAISADGRFVVFSSTAKLGPGNPSNEDVYLARH